MKNSATEHLPSIDQRTISILGVEIADVTMADAIGAIESLLNEEPQSPRSVFFVNAHTLNLAAADRAYRNTLNDGDLVFGDGTGVRWAARAQGIELQDNVNGTDLTPALLDATADRGFRYFLLGADRQSIERAAEHYRRRFPGWTLAGYHHGYVNDSAENQRAIDAVNAAEPHLLLVGMGNPIQERWIAANAPHLRVPVAMAVGGLLDYAAGNIRRAPTVLRRCGMEWLGLLSQQPKKAGRYLIGNPLFLFRVLCDSLARPFRRQAV
jgi:N-acetylglucosaminyldiphosphoundecaprenol N-acetyl-beta-D-mannosaminyltransferase